MEVTSDTHNEKEALLQSSQNSKNSSTPPKATYKSIVNDSLEESVNNEGVEFKSSDNGCCSMCDRIYPSGFLSEAKNMFHITWPIVSTQICQMIIGPISLIFCGHLGDAIKLDGAALAISMINATCIAVGQGLGTACDTFFSQTFGSKNKKNVGIYLQKSILIFLIFLMGCFCVTIHMEEILVFVGQNPIVARLAGQYMIIFMPGALSFFMYVILSKYIQNQNIVIPNVVIGLIANAINALLHYIFLYQLGWETRGSAIAQSVAYFVMFVLTLLYILISKCYEDTWDGWSTECLQDWGKFVRLCIPGMLMLCMEWWGFEIGVFLTGLLGTTELGAQSVLLQLDSVWFQVPLGIQISCAIRVGQYLGAGQPVQAKTVARLAITLVVFLSFFIVILFATLRYQLPYLFTNVQSVAQLTGDLLPIVTIYIFFDGIAAACKGVLYGTGRQIYGAVLLFLSYYVLALPIGVPLMFLTDLRNAGYWYALAINLVLQAIVLLVIVMRTNWDRQIEKARERAGMIGEDTEEVKSLEEQPPPYRRRRLLSASLTKADIEAVTRPSENLPIWKLVLRRVAAMGIMLMILTGAILVKIFVPVPESSNWNTGELNSSLYGNFTTAMYTPVTGLIVSNFTST